MIGRQTFLITESKKKLDTTIRILNWNISNPSTKKAYRQADWLMRGYYDILVLTEVKSSPGCTHIKDRLFDAGYELDMPDVKGNEYGVMLAHRKEFEVKMISNKVEFLTHRMNLKLFKIDNKEIIIAGVYMPPSANKKKMEKFHEALHKFIDNNLILCDAWIVLGDFNIPYPDKSPSTKNIKLSDRIYNEFLRKGFIDAFSSTNQFEDNSLFRRGKGYRPDNIFITKNLWLEILSCKYLHETIKNRLSDHAAMLLEIKYG